MTKTFLHLLASACALIMATRAEAAELTPWRDGSVLPTGDVGFIFMAERGGYAEKNGLKLDMTMLKGDPLLLKALIAGQLDSYEGSPGSPIVAAAHGGDIRIVACHWQKQNYELWAQPQFTKISDLKGRNIGVSAPGSSPDLFARAALFANGITPKDVNLVPAGTPGDLISSLGQKVIDAAATPIEYGPRARALHLIRLTDSNETAPEFMRRCFYVTKDTLEHRRPLLVRFLAAELEAYAFTLGHRDAEIALARDIGHYKPDAPEPGIAYDDTISRHVVDPHFSVPIDKLRWLNALLVKTGNVQPGFDLSAMIDTGPLKEALALAAKTELAEDANHQP